MSNTNKIFVLFFLIFIHNEIFSWEKDEHHRLAEMVFESTLTFCNISFDDSLIFIRRKSRTYSLSNKLWNNLSFWEISSFFSGNDISQSRCHSPGRTVLQQLDHLTASYIDRIWKRIQITPDDIQSVEASNQNAVFNYLLYHLLALRFAGQSDEDSEDSNMLRYALTYEAAAQSYLSDCFSSGHMLLSVSDFLAPLNSLNIQITHDYYCSEGVYVINSRDECWQAFGDNLLQWYAYPFNQVREACTTSLREVFLVYFSSLKKTDMPESLNKWALSISLETSAVELSNLWISSRDGAEIYSEIKIPALLYIPMLVSATWSTAADMKDEYGITIRKHYPQLIDDNFHDPDLNEIDKEFLYTKNSVPNWMIPGFLPCDSIQSLIKYNPSIASVRFVQDRYLPPSYQGYLLSVSGSYLREISENKFGASVGLGWGFSDEFLFILNKPALIVSAMKLSGDKHEWFLMTDFGVGINTPMFGTLFPHVEFGYAWCFKSAGNESGSKYAVGFDSATIPLGFTYAGLTIRLKYQVMLLNKTIQSPMLEIILH